MQKLLQNIEKAKSIAEHISIILIYQNTGFLDRSKAIEVYKSFNLAHSDFNILMNITAVTTNTLIQIDSATDEIIIENLKKQILWTTSEDFLKSKGISI